MSCEWLERERERTDCRRVIRERVVDRGSSPEASECMHYSVCRVIRRAITLVLAACALATGLAGCGQDQPEPQLTATEVMPDMTGADPRLVKLVGQADELLPGGKPAFQSRIRSLKGLPVVANKWASWCAPCRAEATVFQNTAKELGNRVAFLGVNVNDPVDESEAFRAAFPMPYPSYDDPSWKIAALLPPSDKQPVTGIYDRQGRLAHLEIGAYKTPQELKADIERYAGPIGKAPGD